MMSFIEVTSSNGYPMCINPNLLISYYPVETGYTKLYFVDGTQYYIKTSYKLLNELIGDVTKLSQKEDNN